MPTLRTVLLAASLQLLASAAVAQAPAAAPPAPRSGAVAPPAGAAPQLTLLKAAHLIDGRSNAARDGVALLIEGDRIREVGDAAALARKAPGARVLDLGQATLLPGLIDAHTHVLLQGDITQADYDEQILKQSTPYRAILATAAVRTALGNGFTAMRDLETEGAMYADVDLKKAIERGAVPGPRMFVATRAFAPTGMYPLMGYSWELKMPEGVQIADGPDNLRKAVREQAKYGADWIKFYSDRRYFLTDDPKRPVRSWVNYTDDEMQAMVGEAHRIGKKVAAHAIGWDGIDASLRAGVDSIEHGDGLTDDLLDRMVAKGVYWCPTIFVGAYVAEGRGGIWPRLVQIEKEAFGRALAKKVRIAYGTDAGGYAWTENQAQELSYMVRYGMSPMAALQSATRVAAELLGEEKNFGTLEAGKLADVIAVDGDVLRDISRTEHVRFVMKGGAVFRNDLAK
ncbi:MAG: amidohydrolase family protein [Myxococcales bacterium]